MWRNYLPNFAKNLVAVVSVAVIAAIVFYTGFYFGTQKPKHIVVEGVENVGENRDDNVDFGLFWEAWDLLRHNHLKGEKVSNQDLLYGSIAGLTDSLGDPYTVFFSPEDSTKFQEDIGGNFGGVGMEIEVRSGQLLVVAPLKDTPADQAGIRAGDKILKIDGESSQGLDVESAVKKIRGEIGTKVVLTVIRDSWSEAKDVSITRDNIHIPTLEWEMKEDIAYVRLMSFNNNSLPDFYEAILKSLWNGSRGMVLDLRNNPGGYLEVATRLAGWFVDNGEIIVSEELRDGSRQEFRADGNEALKNMPIVILVNQGSASASEILAGALRDLRGIKLIGETTFGKGTVQQLLPLSDGSMIKVTTAHWVLPSGYILSDSGLEPDFEVKLSEDDIASGNDVQLEKALEVIHAEIK